MTTKVATGNNVPIQSPLFPDPFVPYECKNNRTITAVCRTDEAIIKKYLEQTPFEYVDNTYTVTIADFGNCNKGSFLDCAIVIPAKYKDIVGGHYLFEYENEDFAIAAGRELWGYPKKYAELSLEEIDGKVIASAVKAGKEIIRLEFDLNSEIEHIPEIKLTPHLNLHTVPNPTGKGILYQNVIARDTTPDFQLKSTQQGKITVKLGGDKSTPLEDLKPHEVLGGTYTVGDFYATEENGWGKIIDRLK
ncbi:acetoacetate decarboxylase family protein [Alkalihalobacillus sp. TS-13]|uniref:acetoacetate decarboxylase family protein n=1 Tax=Alkalihalobacillus sp. TS-13 TaxID=2842455 RepID=UPI001C884D08|nr:acetoacetate decarboxylase family protein [Alkalihalobacillus sp. TS-13]